MTSPFSLSALSNNHDETLGSGISADDDKAEVHLSEESTVQSVEDENEAEQETVVISPLKHNSSDDVTKDITLEGTTTNDLSLDQNASIECSDQTDEVKFHFKNEWVVWFTKKNKRIMVKQIVVVLILQMGM